MGEIKTTGNSIIDSALEIAFQFAGFEGDHHKAWCIDQMVIALCGGEDSETYKEFVETYENPDEEIFEEELNFEEENEEEDEEYTIKGWSIYEWDKGIAP